MPDNIEQQREATKLSEQAAKAYGETLNTVEEINQSLEEQSDLAKKIIRTLQESTEIPGITDEIRRKSVSLAKELEKQVSLKGKANAYNQLADYLAQHSLDLQKSLSTNMKNYGQSLLSIYNTSLQWKTAVGATAAHMTHMSRAANQAAKWTNVISSAFPTLTKHAKSLLPTLTVVFGIFESAWELFKRLEESAWEFRKATGLTRLEAKGFKDISDSLYIQYTHLGVTIDSVYKTFGAIRDEVGSLIMASTDLVKNWSVMASQLGISEEIVGKFYKTISSVQNSTIETQRYMVGIAKVLSNASGVSLPKVMEDVATSSGNTVVMIRRSSIELIKAAVEARRFGLTLEKVTSAGRSILNFTQSINSEMEASVLLGRSVDLQRARELAYRRDTIGSMKEILRISKSINLDQLDPFQVEAFAKATGFSVDELQKMLQTEKQMDWIRTRGSEQQKQMLSQLERSEKLRNSELENIGMAAELELQRKSNQTRMVELQLKWNQLLYRLGEQLIPVFSTLLDIANALIVPIGSWIKVWTPSLVLISSIGIGLGKMTSWLARSSSIAGVLLKTFGIFGPTLGRIGGFFLRFLGPIGWAITAIQVLAGSINGFADAWRRYQSGEINFGSFILEGLKAVGKSIYDLIVSPFQQAWNWLKGTFFGNSPSQLGLLILNGISSVAGSIYENLIWPFKSAWNFVRGLFGQSSDLAKSSTISLENKLKDSPKLKLDELSDTNISEGKVIVNVPMEEVVSELKNVKEILSSLLLFFKDNGLNVNIDSQYFSLATQRTGAFRNGYGTNKFNVS